MPTSIEDLSPIDRKYSRVLRVIANATAVYPLLFVGLIYGQWLLSWYLLGHRPEWSTDDPKQITGAIWIYVIAQLTLIGMLPAAVAACLSNLAYLYVFRPSAIRGAIRLQTALAIWLGVLAWCQRDPHGVVEWWFD